MVRSSLSIGNVMRDKHISNVKKMLQINLVILALFR